MCFKELFQEEHYTMRRSTTWRNMHKMKYNKAIHNIVWQLLEFQEFGSFLASKGRTKIRDNHKGNIVGWHSRFLIACAHFWASLKWRVSASSWLSCCSLCHRVINSWEAVSLSCWTSGVPWECLPHPRKQFPFLGHSAITYSILQVNIAKKTVTHWELIS